MLVPSGHCSGTELLVAVLLGYVKTTGRAAVLEVAETLAADSRLGLHSYPIFERVRRPERSVRVGGLGHHTQRDLVAAADCPCCWVLGHLCC